MGYEPLYHVGARRQVKLLFERNVFANLCITLYKLLSKFNNHHDKSINGT